MVQVIRVYNTKANAIAGGTTGIIVSQTVDSNPGAIANLHDDNDDIPYFIYNRYYYRIDANEPVKEFHIDWDDGEDNSPEKRNIQIIKLDIPSFFTVVEHIYTEAVTEAKKFFPMIRVKNIDGFLSKWYTNDAAENIAHSSTKALESFSSSLGNDQNESSILSFEKAGADLIPHFCPAHTPPVALLKTDRKRIFGGINNRAISNIEDGGATYPLLYLYSTASSVPEIKLTIGGKHDRAIRIYNGNTIIDADADINSAAEIAKYCMPYNATGDSQDSAEILLRAELLNATTLGDNERVYIKVFNAVNDLSGSGDVSADETVCVLSNGNPIIDLNEPGFSFTVDSSESFSQASNISIKNTYLDDDNLYNSTIQSQASFSTKQGNHSDEFHADLAVTSTSDAYNNTQLSYSHDNTGHVMDSDSRFYDFNRLVRVQVEDDYGLPTDVGDKANRRSFVEHYDDDQYVSTVNSGGLKIPTNLQSRGVISFSNDDDVEEALWQDLATRAKNDQIMIGGGSGYILRYLADTTTDGMTRTHHPKNHLLLCKSDLFDRIYFRLDNTYADSDTPVSVDITAQYAHVNGWKPLEIEDGTLGLKTSGGIKFKIPPDWKKMAYDGIESGTWTGPVPAVSTGGARAGDPATLWDFDAYGILISFNVKASAAAIQIKNIWPFNNSHSQLIRVVDGHHVSLNSIAVTQSISFSRQGKFINMEDRFGRTEIRKLGAGGGSITFGSVDLGDTDAAGNRKKIKSYQQNATPVFIDVTHKSGEKTRFYGIIKSMSEDHPTGTQFPKYAVQMQISHIIEMDSSGDLLSDKISIGGKIYGARKYVSTT